jgi:hypothetical protein
MTRMAVVTLSLVFLIIGFSIGKVVYDKPPKVVEKRIKVYDFTQSPRIMEIYANTMGYELVNKTTNTAYQRGWEEGYGAGYSSGKEFKCSKQ